MKTFIKLACACLLLLLPCNALANNARDYLPLDPGSFFMAFYYEHSFGNELYAKGDKINTSTDFTSNIAIIRPVYFTQIGPFTIDPQFILPVGEANLVDSQSSGIGDLTLAATVWFINDKENKFIFAYSPFLTLPTGKYDRTNAVNLGANRFSTKQEVTVAKGFGDKTWLEMTVNCEFYFNNDDVNNAYLEKSTMSQDPSVGGEAHLSYNFTKDFFGSADYFYKYSGESTIDGLNQHDWDSRHTVGVSFGYMLTANTQLLPYFKTDVSTYNGIPTTLFGIRLAFIF